MLRLSLTEYEEMIAAGAFEPLRDRRLELILGELREMNPPGPSHSDLVDLLNEWSVRGAPQQLVRVRVQNPLGIPELDSAPQPDIAWVRRRNYRKRYPVPRDVLLVIEVSDSSLRYDRGEKAMLYAQAGVQDYWVVDLNSSSIEVCRKPKGRHYADRAIFGKGELVRPVAAPRLKLAVGQLFP